MSAIFLSGLLVFLGAQIYSSLGRERELRREFDAFKEKLEQAKREQAALQSEFDFYSVPENLEKELRARFNYRESGEKMIILVPKAGAPKSTPQ